jgi:hypothetical protein
MIFRYLVFAIALLSVAACDQQTREGSLATSSFTAHAQEAAATTGTITKGPYTVCDPGKVGSHKDETNKIPVTGTHLKKDDQVIVGDVDMITEVTFQKQGATAQQPVAEEKFLMVGSAKNLAVAQPFPHKRTQDGTAVDIVHLITIKPRPGYTGGSCNGRNVILIRMCSPIVDDFGNRSFLCSSDLPHFGHVHADRP